MLDLVAVDELLLEQAELVIDAVAERRVVERGERIEEARGEAAEAAVAQAHVHLGVADLLEILAERLERGHARSSEQAGGEQVVAEQPAHEVFEREIVDAADVLALCTPAWRSCARGWCRARPAPWPPTSRAASRHLEAVGVEELQPVEQQRAGDRVELDRHRQQQPLARHRARRGTAPASRSNHTRSCAARRSSSTRPAASRTARSAVGQGEETPG
jgi:hypothetical protein